MNESHIFANALKFASPAEGAAYLDKACAGNPQLRAGVEALLRAQTSDPDFLEQPPGSLADTADAPASPSTRSHEPVTTDQPGIVLAGRYKLLEQIGEGGMGTVWMAQQTEPVKRLVAVKLIKDGMGSKAVLARFEAERQALALMDHPNIAKVHDAGTTPDGRPFFVMELVKGVPVTKYCDDHHLTPRQRLELFVPICHAIQHAHQKGVIHRDLKPSNVLVVLYDDQPVPKVIDFGVAKATGQQLTEQTLHTGFGAVVGTVEYMSPEQASFNQLDVDTRSDIYSLGVLLYELLTGSPPFSRKDLEKVGVLEMFRVIREQEPSKPSTKLSTAEGLPTLAANRGMEPARLTRLVRGELDWIVMKALEKDRSRRYETANALARDLQHYLADEVVEARPPSAGYRFRKFVRRNRGHVLASAALALSLIAGIGAVLAVKAQADRNQAAAATDRATREAWTTASVSAACREARERADEAWAVTDYPDRMQQSTDAALAALHRADDYVAGGVPTEATLAELESTRQAVDDLARHTRLITAVAQGQRLAVEGGRERSLADHFHDLFHRTHEALRQFGLDPIGRRPDEVARAIATSRIRDDLLGTLMEWSYWAHVLDALLRDNPKRAFIPADAPAINTRLAEVIRSTRLLCGGPYARWQDLLDRQDVQGLVAFAASPDALSFRASLVRQLGRDLLHTADNSVCRNYLRAAVERYQQDALLHFDLSVACQAIQPPEKAEALRHISAASALWPECRCFHFGVGSAYLDIEAYDLAIAAYRKTISMSPSNAALAKFWLGQALVHKKDWEGAITALREAIPLLTELTLDMLLPSAHQYLGMALSGAGRHNEALQQTLGALEQNPTWARNPGNLLRYNAAFFAMRCAEGKGASPPPPVERPMLRKKALDLLTADLGEIRRLSPGARAFVYQTMQRWLVDEDFASVRDPKALEQLPADERDAWKKFWADVRDLRNRTAPPELAPPPRNRLPQLWRTNPTRLPANQNQAGRRPVSLRACGGHSGDLAG